MPRPPGQDLMTGGRLGVTDRGHPALRRKTLGGLTRALTATP
jgi:hypothetical protein